MDLKSIILKTENVSIDKLKEFQGNFKDLSKSNFEKLKKQILENGFASPFSVWEDKGIIYVLDGHQRLRVLKELQKEMKVPDLPCNFIKCKDKKHAKKLVLALSSVYGEISNESFYEFLNDSELFEDFEILKQEIDLPEIDLGEFEAGFLKDIEIKEKEECKCPNCGALLD